jgi:uncharacterized transporter YbjL
MTKPFAFLLGLCLLSTGLQAQDPQMADALRNDGKIYVVISVIVLIFLALAGFIVALDRRITKLENKQKQSS